MLKNIEEVAAYDKPIEELVELRVAYAKKEGTLKVGDEEKFREDQYRKIREENWAVKEIVRRAAEYISEPTPQKVIQKLAILLMLEEKKSANLQYVIYGLVVLVFVVLAIAA